MLSAFAQAHTDPAQPPDQWTQAAKISEAIYYSHIDGGPESILIWHWCPKMVQWLANGTFNHTIEQADPLTLSPSYYLPWCCGLHGFIHDGEWAG